MKNFFNTKNPFLYAITAALYIVVIVLIINVINLLLPKDNIITPMVVLGLLVLSVATMGFLFLSEPIRLYIDNKKQEAFSFFVKIVGFFACFVVLFLILLFLV